MHHRHPVAVEKTPVVRHLGGGDEIAPPKVDGIEAELPRRDVHQPLGDEGRLRAPGAAVGRARHLVGDDDAPATPERRDAIETDQVGGGDAGHDGPAREVGAGVDQKVVGQAEDATVGRESERRGMKLVASVSRAEKAPRPRVVPADRAAESPRQRRDEQLLRVYRPLRAEAAAHIGRGDADGVERELERLGDALPHAVGHLGARPDVQARSRPVPLRGDGPGLERQRREAAAAHTPGDDERGPPERRLPIA